MSALETAAIIYAASNDYRNVVVTQNEIVAMAETLINLNAFIAERISTIHADPLVQRKPADVDVNAYVAIMQTELAGELAGLRNVQKELLK